jgi:hypothetical protein
VKQNKVIMKRFLVRTEPDADKLIHEDNDVKQVKPDVNELEVAGTSSSKSAGLQVES